MKREIKFRAWVYHYILDKYQMRDFESIKNFCGAFFFEPEKYTPNPHVLMQFTGLTDKKGKEIYEGDIIKFGSQLGSISEVKFIEKNGGFLVKDKFGDWKWLYDVLGSTNSEVIGNIYENPELL
jgi:uncharacterized phage protein (TIGR01671 family)